MTDTASGRSPASQPIKEHVDDLVVRFRANPSAFDVHEALFALLDDASSNGGTDRSPIFEAAASLPALTVKDCAYKLALARLATENDPGNGSFCAHLSLSLLHDLVQISGAEGALAFEEGRG